MKIPAEQRLMSSFTISCECGVGEHVHIPAICLQWSCFLSITLIISRIISAQVTSSLSQHPLSHPFESSNCSFATVSHLPPAPASLPQSVPPLPWTRPVSSCLTQVSATISAATVCSETEPVLLCAAQTITRDRSQGQQSCQDEL